MSDQALDVWQDRIVGFPLSDTIVLLPLVFVSTGFDPFRFPKVLVGSRQEAEAALTRLAELLAERGLRTASGENTSRRLDREAKVRLSGISVLREQPLPEAFEREEAAGQDS
jgi:hypothetical protein